jgi:hypothetical protein
MLWDNKGYLVRVCEALQSAQFVLIRDNEYAKEEVQMVLLSGGKLRQS